MPVATNTFIMRAKTGNITSEVGLHKSSVPPKCFNANILKDLSRKYQGHTKNASWLDEWTDRAVSNDVTFKIYLKFLYLFNY